MDNKQIFIKEYPYNLIYAVVKNNSLAFPVTSKENIILGLEYVLSKLEKHDVQFLRDRYEAGKPLEEVCANFALSEEDAKEWEQRIFKKLRRPTRWGYIQFGIEGYVKNRIVEIKQEAYHEGYVDGYQKGLQDGPSGDVGKNLPEHILNMPIEVMGLTTHAYNCLLRRHCERVRDVIALNEDDIYRIRNMGKVTARIIAEKLRELGIYNTSWDKYLI